MLKPPRPECPGGSGSIEFGQSQYLIVDGFVLDGQFDASSIANFGIGTGAGARHIRFQNIEVRHFRSNVNSMGSYLEFSTCMCIMGALPCTAREGGVFSLLRGASHNLIDGGRIHDNHCNGIQFSLGVAYRSQYGTKRGHL